MSALLDTSVFVAREQGRTATALPADAFISVVTLAELHVGVLNAEDPNTRATRLETLTETERAFDALPIDAEVAREFARLVSEARRAGRRPPVLDTLIAATAVVYDLDLYTQDADFEGLRGLRVVGV